MTLDNQIETMKDVLKYLKRSADGLRELGHTGSAMDVDGIVEDNAARLEYLESKAAEREAAERQELNDYYWSTR